MILLHHLRIGRSMFTVWQLEELGAEYELKVYHRDPATFRAQDDLKAVHPLGKSPVIEDGELINPEVAETRSGVYGDHRLIHSRSNDVISMIEFDIAISVEGAGEEQRLHISAVKSESVIDPAAQGRSLSRIRFTIPVELPRPF